MVGVVRQRHVAAVEEQARAGLVLQHQVPGVVRGHAPGVVGVHVGVVRPVREAEVRTEGCGARILDGSHRPVVFP